MKKPILFLFFIFFIIIVLSLVQVFVANRISTTGVDLEKIQNSIQHYKKENALLNEKILTQASLVRISEVAIKEGYTLEKSQVYLSTPLPLALKQ